MVVTGDVFGFESVDQPTGYLPTGSQNDSLWVIDVSDWDNPVLHDLLPDRTDEFFYHRIVWKDMDGDGRKDALTSRARVPPAGNLLSM